MLFNNVERMIYNCATGIQCHVSQLVNPVLLLVGTADSGVEGTDAALYEASEGAQSRTDSPIKAQVEHDKKNMHHGHNLTETTITPSKTTKNCVFACVHDACSCE